MFEIANYVQGTNHFFNLNMNQDDSFGYIHNLVRDYTSYYLWKKGVRIDYFNSTPLTESPINKVKNTIRMLCDEFEEKYDSIFEGLCSQIDISHSSARANFFSVVNELFSEGVNWPRIIALFSLSGAICFRLYNNNEEILFDQTIEWTCMYIRTHLAQWIQDHDGWNGLVDFSKGNPEKRNESPWPTLKNFFCGVAAGALGALTLGAILTSKT